MALNEILKANGGVYSKALSTQVLKKTLDPKGRGQNLCGPGSVDLSSVTRRLLCGTGFPERWRYLADTAWLPYCAKQ
ncbi:hypothetical protein J3P95_12885 [Pseudomonas sp. Z5-35]|uniref:hypothetical protein n=1 Tax=unclassified Pseudomonas TaxID=196821 RepID=UPI003DA97B37